MDINDISKAIGFSAQKLSRDQKKLFEQLYKSGLDETEEYKKIKKYTKAH